MTRVTFYTLIFLLISLNSNSATLYNSSDPIVQLDATNFHSTIHNKTNAWIVEFYNSWCGHCINFAPIWRTFANDIKEWKNVMKVAAVDCSEEINTPLCRDYSVKFFPTIKFFRPHSQSTDFGIIRSNLNGMATVDVLRESVVDFLQELQWPDVNITKASNLVELKNSIKPSVNYVVIIIEKETSHLGREILLEFYDYADVVQVIRISEENDLKSGLNVTSVPFVGLFSPDLKEMHELHIPSNSPQIISAIRETLNLNPIISDKEKGNLKQDEPIKTHLSSAPEQISMIDLENSINYTLFHELALHKSINGTNLQVLKTFINILALYFPGRLPVRNFLTKLNEWMENLTDFKIEDLQLFHNQVQSADIFLPPRQDWVTCKGSREGLRGYPCSLWILFHTLTVSAYNSHKENPSFNPLTVPRAISNYIEHFFSCRECSKHFQTMSSSLRTDITEPKHTVLWFWKAHNRVNLRLANDSTEDPQHPKIQFPPTNLCESCKSHKSNNEWNEDKVLQFLTNWYSTINAAGVASWSPPVDGPHHAMRLLDVKLVDEPIAVRVDERSHSWSFSTLDMSLCLSLYICSALILLTVYFVVIVKRRMKKKQRYPLPYV